MNIKELKDKIHSEGIGLFFSYRGYSCDVKRHPRSLHLCGYVKIKESSILYGKFYEDEIFSGIDVHGGLTYSGPLTSRTGWRVGFDCAHAGDVIPVVRFKFLSSCAEESYKDMNFVRKELEKLVDQIIEIEEKTNGK